MSMSTMTAYLAGELPAEDAAQIEEFLRTEPLLRETYAGLLAAWQAPNAERAVTADEVDAGYARFKTMVAAKGGTPKR
jgi:anti-sigma factor RsiW